MRNVMDRENEAMERKQIKKYFGVHRINISSDHRFGQHFLKRK